jgi:hypothetical protein
MRASGDRAVSRESDRPRRVALRSRRGGARARAGLAELSECLLGCGGSANSEPIRRGPFCGKPGTKREALWSIGAWPLCTSTDSLEDDVNTAPLVLASARVLANGGPPPASKFCIDDVAEEQPVPRKSEWLLVGWKWA